MSYTVGRGTETAQSALEKPGEKLSLGVAARLMRMNADQGAAVVKLIDAAQQNIDPLANVAAGIGTNLNVSA